MVCRMISYKYYRGRDIEIALAQVRCFEPNWILRAQSEKEFEISRQVCKAYILGRNNTVDQPVIYLTFSMKITSVQWKMSKKDIIVNLLESTIWPWRNKNYIPYGYIWCDHSFVQVSTDKSHLFQNGSKCFQSSNGDTERAEYTTPALMGIL